jgi:hypothetical protein
VQDLEKEKIPEACGYDSVSSCRTLRYDRLLCDVLRYAALEL